MIALLYFKKAAEKRCISAYSNIGYMFENGLGTTKNYEEAFKNYKYVIAFECLFLLHV